MLKIRGVFEFLGFQIFPKWVPPDHKRGLRLRWSRLSAESLSSDLAVINSSDFTTTSFEVKFLFY